MIKTWQYYYFLIRGRNRGVKVMNTHLYKHLPPKTHLEVLGGASAQWSFRSPFLTRYSPLARAPQHPEDPRLWGKGGCTPPIDAHTSPKSSQAVGVPNVMTRSRGHAVHYPVLIPTAAAICLPASLMSLK